MNAKQEILDAVDELSTCIERGWPISAFGFIRSIRAILETHTLEPIDDRPFDPALCGFTYADHCPEDADRCWDTMEYRLCLVGEYGRIESVIVGEDYFEFPWPLTQSDGERLLKLLGVLTT